MIVIILLLILLTLLFGANAVKTGVGQTLTVVCGGFLAFFVIVWIGSAFGESGVKVGFWIGVGMICLFALSKVPKTR